MWYHKSFIHLPFRKLVKKNFHVLIFFFRFKLHFAARWVVYNHYQLTHLSSLLIKGKRFLLTHHYLCVLQCGELLCNILLVSDCQFSQHSVCIFLMTGIERIEFSISRTWKDLLSDYWSDNINVITIIIILVITTNK